MCRSFHLSALLAVATLLSACATGPQVKTTDAAKPFVDAMMDAIQQDSYLRKTRDANPYVKPANATVYIPEARVETVRDRAAIVGLMQDWCGKNGGELVNQEIIYYTRTRGNWPESDYFAASQYRRNWVCAKGTKGTEGYQELGAASRDSIEWHFLSMEQLAAGYAQREKEDLERRQSAQREAARKSAEAEWAASRTAQVRTNPNLGDRVSVQVCKNPYGKCGSWQLSKENAEVMEIRDPMILVRTFSGATHWVNKSELFAPE
jgi:hypothetical protein